MSSPLQHLPRSARLVLFVLAVVAALYGAHRLTLHWWAGELLAARERIRTLEAEVRVLGERLESAQARRTHAEQAAAVTRQANRLLREEESSRLAELHRLQSELDFYRRLAGTSGTQTGLAVYHLELSPSASPRVYRFVLTLTQNLRRSSITTGTARVTIEGTLDNRPVVLPWSHLAEGNPPPTFRFKYFEQVSGYLTLPAGFDPIRVVVVLDAKGQNKPVTRGFDWQQLTTPGNGGTVAPFSPGGDPPAGQPAAEDAGAR